MHRTRSGPPSAEPSEIQAAVRIASESVPIPQSFLCPISQEIMNEPVVTEDGHVYDKQSIQEWFRRGNRTSPMTGLPLASIALLDEAPLKRAIDDYLKARPEILTRNLDYLSIQSAAATLEAELQAKAANFAETNPQDGAEVSYTGTDLFDAVKQGRTARCIAIMESLDSRAINAKDGHGFTILHHAAKKGLASVCFAALGHKAFTQTEIEVNVDGTGCTATELAVAGGHVRLAAAIDAFLRAESNTAKRPLPCANEEGTSHSSSRARLRPRPYTDDHGGRQDRSRSLQRRSGYSVPLAPPPPRAPLPPQRPSSSSQDGRAQAERPRLPWTPPLRVSGCQDQTVSKIIAGTYLPDSVNHGKIVYKKSGRPLDVLIYYWDDRDGSDLSGWWFGPRVGSDKVWAYHPSVTAGTPPASQWNIPHHGDIDPSFYISAAHHPQLSG